LNFKRLLSSRISIYFQNAVAEAAVTAIGEKHGKKYVYGSSFNTLSATSGTAKDHMYAHYKTPLSYTFEFRVADGVRWVLPPEEIKPNAEEVFAGLLAMIEKAGELGYY
jgi:Zinc carboxypeptidase